VALEPARLCLGFERLVLLIDNCRELLSTPLCVVAVRIISGALTGLLRSQVSPLRKHTERIAPSFLAILKHSRSEKDPVARIELLEAVFRSVKSNKALLRRLSDLAVEAEDSRMLHDLQRVDASDARLSFLAASQQEWNDIFQPALQVEVTESCITAGALVGSHLEDASLSLWITPDYVTVCDLSSPDRDVLLAPSAWTEISVNLSNLAVRIKPPPSVSIEELACVLPLFRPEQAKEQLQRSQSVLLSMSVPLESHTAMIRSFLAHEWSERGASSGCIFHSKGAHRVNLTQTDLESSQSEIQRGPASHAAVMLLRARPRDLPAPPALLDDESGGMRRFIRSAIAVTRIRVRQTPPVDPDPDIALPANPLQLEQAETDDSESDESSVASSKEEAPEADASESDESPAAASKPLMRTPSAPPGGRGQESLSELGSRSAVAMMKIQRRAPPKPAPVARQDPRRVLKFESPAADPAPRRSSRTAAVVAKRRLKSVLSSSQEAASPSAPASSEPRSVSSSSSSAETDSDSDAPDSACSSEKEAASPADMPVPKPQHRRQATDSKRCTVEEPACHQPPAQEPARHQPPAQEPARHQPPAQEPARHQPPVAPAMQAFHDGPHQEFTSRMLRSPEEDDRPRTTVTWEASPQLIRWQPWTGSSRRQHQAPHGRFLDSPFTGGSSDLTHIEHAIRSDILPKLAFFEQLPEVLSDAKHDLLSKLHQKHQADFRTIRGKLESALEQARLGPKEDLKRLVLDVRSRRQRRPLDAIGAEAVRQVEARIAALREEAARLRAEVARHRTRCAKRVAAVQELSESVVSSRHKRWKMASDVAPNGVPSSGWEAVQRLLN
jgi:uncharacterized small protein (DUF1192 family)